MSNAELIKACLFQDKKLAKTAAIEWDQMEQILQNDDFWYFFNPDPDNERFDATHIDFIFEMLLRKDRICETSRLLVEENINENEKDRTILPDILKKNPYYIFSLIFKSIKDKDEEKNAIIWREVQSIFRRIHYWFENRKLYHYIGFLMNNRSYDKEKHFEILSELLVSSEKETKTVFEKNVKQQIKEVIIPQNGKKLDKLVYNIDNAKLNDVLLLFNIAIICSHDCEISRYPFSEHKKGAWSLEHIHAKNERVICENDINNIADIMGIKVYGKKDELIKEINEQCKDIINKELIQQYENENNKWIIDDSEENTNGLENLALLASPPNSSFNNNIYMEKRRALSEWERDETTGKKGYHPAYIPIGTRMVFFKHFSDNDKIPFMWTSINGETYFNHIVKTIKNFIDCDEKELVSGNEE